MVREGFNVEPHVQQLQVLEAIQAESTMPFHKRKKRFVIVSAQGGGKSAMEVWVAVWRCLRHVSAVSAVTAPGMRQVGQWFDELRRQLSSAHPVLQRHIRVLKSKAVIAGQDGWEIRGMTATTPGKIAGLHQTHLGYIVDEANEMLRPLIQTIEGTLTNQDSIMLLAGNPISINNSLHDACTKFRNLYHVFHFDRITIARDRPDIIAPEENEKLLIQYGKDSDFYRVRVLGLFPNKNSDTLMGINDLEACTKNNMLECAARRNILPENRAFGLDFSRYGGDKNVMVQRQGLAVIQMEKYLDMDPNELVGRAFFNQNISRWDDRDCIFIADAGGLGQGVMHNFHQQGKRLVAFHTEGKAFESRIFANKMAEAWWNLSKLVEKRLVYLPDDPDLLQQLSSRKYIIDDKTGKIDLQSKDEWKKDVEQDISPDEADATAMAFYSPHRNGVSMLQLDRSRTPRRL